MNYVFKIPGLNPIQDVVFQGGSQRGGGKNVPRPKICHMSYNDETWQLYLT